MSFTIDKYEQSNIQPTDSRNQYFPKLALGRQLTIQTT